MKTEKHLVDEFLNSGSETAFVALYRHYAPYLYQFSLRLSSQDKKAAEEIFQETWVRAVKQLAGFEWRSTLKTWLTAILINTNKEFVRKSTRESTIDQEVITSMEPISLQVGEKMDLEGAIASLPAGYKQVLLLHDVHGYTHKEIGDMLNVSEGTSKSQLFQARKAMRNYLNEGIK